MLIYILFHSVYIYIYNYIIIYVYYADMFILIDILRYYLLMYGYF